MAGIFFVIDVNRDRTGKEKDDKTVTITLSDSETFDTITDKLVETGVVRYRFAYNWICTRYDFSKPFKTGETELRTSMSYAEIYEAIIDTVNVICNAVRQVLNRTDPDLVADITEDGMYLTGGGSLLSGMAEKLEEYLGVSVHRLDDPTHSVVKGAAAALKNPELLKNVDYQMRSIKELAVE